ncbi:MAG: RHS repeat-associated core domain-containing protein [Marinilabiliaceae bacterium]
MAPLVGDGFINKHLGTPQKMVDESGSVVWAAAYAPFGEARVYADEITNNLRFPGQYYDVETGLHYNWHRYYDPGTGRYLRADPIGLGGGLNLYAYALNNPTNSIDPFGLFVGDVKVFESATQSVYRRTFGQFVTHIITAKTAVASAVAMTIVVGTPASTAGPEYDMIQFEINDDDCNKKKRRNQYQKKIFLKNLAKSGKNPSWMNQWLQKGKVPPGYEVDHIVPLSVGGVDKPSNMRLQGQDLHKNHHRFYHPWR